MKYKILMVIGTVIGVLVLSIVGSQLWIDTASNAQVEDPEFPVFDIQSDATAISIQIQDDQISITPDPTLLASIPIADVSNAHVIYLTKGIEFRNKELTEEALFSHFNDYVTVSSMDELLSLDNNRLVDAVVIDNTSADLIDSLWLINAMNRGVVFAAINVPLEDVARLRGSQCELDSLSQMDLWWETNGHDYYYIRAFSIVGENVDDVILVRQQFQTSCTMASLAEIKNVTEGYTYGGVQAFHGPLELAEVFAGDLESAIGSVQLTINHAHQLGAFTIHPLVTSNPVK